MRPHALHSTSRPGQQVVALLLRQRRVARRAGVLRRQRQGVLAHRRRPAARRSVADVGRQRRFHFLELRLGLLQFLAQRRRRAPSRSSRSGPARPCPPSASSPVRECGRSSPRPCAISFEDGVLQLAAFLRAVGNLVLQGVVFLLRRDQVAICPSNLAICWCVCLSVPSFWRIVDLDVLEGVVGRLELLVLAGELGLLGLDLQRDAVDLVLQARDVAAQAVEFTQGCRVASAMAVSSRTPALAAVARVARRSVQSGQQKNRRPFRTGGCGISQSRGACRRGSPRVAGCAPDAAACGPPWLRSGGRVRGSP